MATIYRADICLRLASGMTSMIPWIKRHAAKLSVQITVLDHAENRLVLRAEGPEEMVQALALGCTLGPIGAAVTEVEVLPREVDLP